MFRSLFTFGLSSPCNMATQFCADVTAPHVF